MEYSLFLRFKMKLMAGTESLAEVLYLGQRYSVSSLQILFSSIQLVQRKQTKGSVVSNIWPKFQYISRLSVCITIYCESLFQCMVHSPKNLWKKRYIWSHGRVGNFEQILIVFVKVAWLQYHFILGTYQFWPTYSHFPIAAIHHPPCLLFDSSFPLVPINIYQQLRTNHSLRVDNFY